MKYIDAEKLIAEIERWRDKAKEKYNKNPYSMGRCDALAEFRNHIVSSLQEQPDFDDVDPKHLVHSHYTKVRETKTGRVFWAEYSSEAAEWYEAGSGKAYSISKVEIVKERPEVDLEKIEKASYKVFPVKKKFGVEIKYPNREDENFSKREIWKDGVIWAIYELGQSTQYQNDRAEFAKLKAKEWQKGFDEGLNAGKED